MSEDRGALAQFEPRDPVYLDVLRRRKWLIVLAAIVAALVAVGLSLRQPKSYRASADVLLASNEGSGATDADTETRVVLSRAVRDLAAKQVPEVGEVSVVQRGDSKVVSISSDSADPERAAVSVNAYVDAYVRYSRALTLDSLEASSRQVQTAVDDLQKQIEDLNRQLSGLGAETQLSQALSLRRNTSINQQSALQEKLRDLQLSTTGASTGGPRVLTPATPPDEPASPKPLTSGLSGLAVGLLLGVGLAFLFEYVDDSVKGPEDVARATSDVPVLAMVPKVPQWKDASEPMVVSLTDPQSPSAEAYRSLRTAVQFLSLDRAVGTLLVTSPSSKEGRTTTVANLAVAMARAGTRTVVIDCDLRMPRLHEFFDLPNDVGLTSVMLGDASLSGALREVPGVDDLQVLPAGPVPPNPSELLASPRFAEVLFSLQSEEGATLLIDSPPLLPVADSSILAAAVDATLVVATVASSTKKRLRRAGELLARLEVGRVEAPVLGAVLNRVALETEDYEFYDVAGKGRRRQGRRHARSSAEEADGEPRSLPASSPGALSPGVEPTIAEEDAVVIK